MEGRMTAFLEWTLFAIATSPLWVTAFAVLVIVMAAKWGKL